MSRITPSTIKAIEECIRDVDNGKCDEACQTNKRASTIHPYIATIKPGIVSCIVKNVAKNGDVIMDPFCGSGTVAVEGSVHGHDVVCSDLNPVATTIQKAKFFTADRGLILKDIGIVREKYAAIDSAPEIHVPNEELWFTRKAVKDLARLKAAMSSASGKNKDLFDAAFSLTVKHASKALDSFNMEWRRPKFGVKKKNDDDVIDYFSGLVNKSVDNLVLGNKKSKITFINADAKDMPVKNGAIDVIITDPPYGSAIDYINGWKAHIDWLENGDHVELKGRQIGGQTSKRSTCNVYVARHPVVKSILAKFPDQSTRRDEKYWCDYANYFNGMEKALKEMSRAAKPGGNMVMRLGDNVATFDGVSTDIPTTDAIIEIARDTGWKLDGSFYRDVDNVKAAGLGMGKWKNGMRRERYMFFTNSKPG